MLSLVLAACANAGGAKSNSDAGESFDEPDGQVFDEPDAGPRPDARPKPDAAPSNTPDAAPGQPDARPTPDAAPPDAGVLSTGDILTKSDFNLSPMFDTGNVADDCTTASPWGKTWGINAVTYSTANMWDIAFARFYVNQGVAYAYAKEDDNRWGFARYMQGDIYGSTYCGSIDWNVFTPVAVSGKDVQAHVRVYRDTSTKLTTTASWVSMSVRIWLSSPSIPKTGSDKNGKKPLLLEWRFFTDCNTAAGCENPVSSEEASAYHFIDGLAPAPLKAWATEDIDVSGAIADAVSQFGLGAAASTLKIYQVELIMNVKQAEAALSFDDFSVDVN